MLSKMKNECTHDCIIVGAGLYGLAAARTYLDIHLGDNVLVLESRPSIGGVWSKERNYDAFWTQTPWNMACFSDAPIEQTPLDEHFHGFFPAKRVTEYVEEFANSRIYAGRSLRERIVFNEKVVRIKFEAETKVWAIETAAYRDLRTRKLMVCSGLTSVPNMPTLPGQEDFKGTIIHHRDFGSSRLFEDPAVSHVAVLGGAKSAADVAYAAAKAGKQVSWIIRKNGSGPGALVPAKGVGPYKNSNEVLYTRLSGMLTPSIWSPESWLLRMLHATTLGRGLVDSIWARFDADASKAGERQKPSAENMEENWKNLQPDTSLFWANDSNGVNQREDFWDVIRSENVRVYREDTTRLSQNEIVMEKSCVRADTIVCCTGWTPSFHSFFDETLEADLGLPIKIDLESDRKSGDDRMLEHWADLDRLSELEIISKFPRLQDPPRHFQAISGHSPFRLWRHMIPCSLARQFPGLAFLGSVVVGNNFRCADVQALWAVAYLDDIIRLPGMEEMQREVSAQVAWCRKRYLEKGKLGHWLWYDLVGYTDTLLHDLGISCKSKKIWQPYVASDLDGAVERLRRKYYTT